MMPSFEFMTGAPKKTAELKPEGSLPITASVALDPISGVPSALLSELARALDAASRPADLALLNYAGAVADFRLKGNLNAVRYKDKVKLVYKWEVSNGSGARLGGTSGNLLLFATGPDPWKAVSGPTLQMVAGQAITLTSGFAKAGSARKFEAAAAAPQAWEARAAEAPPKSEPVAAASLPRMAFNNRETALNREPGLTALKPSAAALKPAAPQAAVEQPALEQDAPLGNPVKEAFNALRLVNAYRRAHGLSPLALDRSLNAAALALAADMARHDRLSHAGPNGADLEKRLKMARYNYAVAAENVAVGQSSAAELIGEWKTQPLESQNLLLPDAKQMGIAFKYNPAATSKTFWALVIAARS